MGTSQHNQGNRGGGNRGGNYRGGNQGGGSNNPGGEEISKHRFPLSDYKQQIDNWIKEKINRETIAFVEVAGRYLAENDMSTSQIRIAFGQLRKIQMNGFENSSTEFLMLTPKLAYAAERHKKVGVWMFYDFFKFASSKIDINNIELGKTQFKNFMQIIEGMLAFHKSYGGKD